MLREKYNLKESYIGGVLAFKYATKNMRFGIDPLTDRELEVLDLLTKGNRNTVISEKLFVSINTVKAHVKSLFVKMKVTDRVQAAVKATLLELVVFDD